MADYGKWRVASHLADWFEEYRLYHRKDGLLVKERDDLLSSSRIAMMMRRYARPLPTSYPTLDREGDSMIADGVDFKVL